MSKHCKCSTNNQWAANKTSDLASCSHCNCGKNKKDQTNNQWTATSKIK